MSLSGLMAQVLTLPQPQAAYHAMDYIRAGIRGPYRADLSRAMRAVAAGDSVGQALEGITGGPTLEASDFVNAGTALRVRELLNGTVAGAHAPGKVRALGRDHWRRRRIELLHEFQQLDDELREAVREVWKSYHQVLSQDTVQPPSFSIHLIKYLDGKKLSKDIVRGLREVSKRFAPIYRVLALGRPDFDFGVPLFEKLHRLQFFYGIELAPAARERLLQAYDELELQEPNNRREAFAVAHQLIPNSTVTERKLLVHCYEYRQEGADHYGFILRFARIYFRNAERLPNLFRKAEKGVGIRRDQLRAASIYYRIPYERLLCAYLTTVGRDFSDLHFYSGPFYYDVSEVPKLEAYRNKPTLGELFCLGRLHSDLTVAELLQAVNTQFPDLRYPKTLYNSLENNEFYPSLQRLSALGTVLGIHVDTILSTMLATFYPHLQHPRLQEEPVYVDPQRMMVDISRILHYMESPGSLEEEIYFRRKRLGLSISTFAASLGVREYKISALEMGKLRPDDDLLAKLAGIFGVDIAIFQNKRK